MKYRIAMWASAGFFVAGFWALYALATTPPSFIFVSPLMALVRLTCPIAFLSSYPIRFYWVLLANAATYALADLIVETLRQQLSHAK